METSEILKKVRQIEIKTRGYMAELRQLWENDQLEFHGSAALEKIYPVF